MNNISTNLYIKFLKDSGVNSFIQNKSNNFYDIKNNQLKTKNLVIFEDIINTNDLVNFAKKSNICKLKKNSKNTLLFKNLTDSPLMIVTDKPTEIDDLNGTLLSGLDGELLKKMLKAVNLQIDKVNIISAIPWKTKNNRDATDEEILQCIPLVQKLIEIIKPKIILLLGISSSKSVLNTNLEIENIRGKWHNYNTPIIKNEIPTLTTFHPSLLLKETIYKKKTWEDLKILQKKILYENL